MSFTFLCSSPLGGGGANVLALVLKNGTVKGMGRKESQPTTCCPFTPSFGDCSISAEVCEKCFTASPSYWVASREEYGVLTLPLSDSVPHFGLHTGKEANLLISKPPTQLYTVVTQTMDINLKIWGRGDTEYNSSWNLKSRIYLIRLFMETWHKADWWGSLRI